MALIILTVSSTEEFTGPGPISQGCVVTPLAVSTGIRVPKPGEQSEIEGTDAYIGYVAKHRGHAVLAFDVRHDYCLPLDRTAVGRHKRRFSELNTRPGCTSVNASPRRLPDDTHHSRPRRLARSHLIPLFHSLPFSGFRRRTGSDVVNPIRKDQPRRPCHALSLSESPDSSKCKVQA